MLPGLVVREASKEGDVTGETVRVCKGQGGGQ